MYKGLSDNEENDKIENINFGNCRKLALKNASKWLTRVPRSIDDCFFKTVGSLTVECRRNVEKAIAKVSAVHFIAASTSLEYVYSEDLNLKATGELRVKATIPRRGCWTRRNVLLK